MLQSSWPFWLSFVFFTNIHLTQIQTLALTLPELRHRSLYQVLTDRFARDDGSSPECYPGRREYCGGTWNGIQKRLGYIQDMGFDTGRLGVRGGMS